MTGYSEGSKQWYRDNPERALIFFYGNSEATNRNLHVADTKDGERIRLFDDDHPNWAVYDEPDVPVIEYDANGVSVERSPHGFVMLKELQEFKATRRAQVSGEYAARARLAIDSAPNWFAWNPQDNLVAFNDYVNAVRQFHRDRQHYVPSYLGGMGPRWVYDRLQQFIPGAMPLVHEMGTNAEGFPAVQLLPDHGLIFSEHNYDPDRDGVPEPLPAHMDPSKWGDGTAGLLLHEAVQVAKDYIDAVARSAMGPTFDDFIRD